MNCLSCGPTNASASREHVFSDWLLREFGHDVAMGLHRVLSGGQSIRTREEIRLTSFTLRKVCQPCNNGWMSILEGKARPIILDIVKRGRQLSDLSEVEREDLARWAAKTAIIESHAIGAEQPVSAHHLKYMRENPQGSPGRFAVVACVTKFDAFGHMQYGIIYDLLGGGKVSGSIIVIALPRLAFVCAFPMLDIPYECKYVKSLFAPLWPDPKAWYPMDQTDMPECDDEVDFLSGLAERVELYHSFDDPARHWQ